LEKPLFSNERAKIKEKEKIGDVLNQRLTKVFGTYKLMLGSKIHA
jgi:hypothetical protein